LKKYIKIDDPLPELYEKIRKGYFESRRPLQELLMLNFRNSVSRMMFNLKRLSLTVIFLFSGIKAVAPVNNTFTIINEPGIRPYVKLMYATAMVETMGNTLAYNEFEDAVGIFQIRQVRIDDYNRRTGNNFSLKEMYDPALSEKVFLYFASLYRPYELEKIAKAWNGSGPMTELYWKRIRRYL